MARPKCIVRCNSGVTTACKKECFFLPMEIRNLDMFGQYLGGEGLRPTVLWNSYTPVFYLNLAPSPCRHCGLLAFYPNLQTQVLFIRHTAFMCALHRKRDRIASEKSTVWKQTFQYKVIELLVRKLRLGFFVSCWTGH